jgi:type IV secretory pathway TrbD component
MAVELEIKGLNQLIKQVEKYPAISEKHVGTAIQRSLVRILGQEKQQAPVGVTGNLRDNWRIDMSRFAGSLRSMAPYSMAVHQGTGPHYVSGETLKAWAARKGLNPWAVAKSIQKHGTKANPFLQRSVQVEGENVNREFSNALGAILKEITS